jgi:hypothetical protein
MEVKRDPSFRCPVRMRTPPERCNGQRLCEYHNDHGHQTKDCITLRREIEIFIQNGKLITFLAGEKRSGNDSQGSPQPWRIVPPPQRAFLEDRHDQRGGRDEPRGG